MAKRRAAKKPNRLEILIAVGAVLFMFLLIGFMNLGQVGNVSREQSASTPTVSTQTIEIQGPVELSGAESDFEVKP